jgi:hypothetical protein
VNGQTELYNANSMQAQIAGSLGPGLGCSELLPSYYYSNLPSPRLPRDYELVIEKVGSEIVLDYGAKLRLLMADPFAGMDLREAIANLKEALKTGG